MRHAILSAITDFGDLALMLPMAAIVLVWLVSVRAKAGAAWWALAILLCTGGTALLKVYFFTCPPAPDLQSPSGHTSLSTLVYGALTFVMALEARGWARLFVAGAGGALVLAIAESRVALNAHSSIEVLLGLGIGLGVLGLFGRGYLRAPPERTHLPALLVAIVATVALLHGANLRAEELLHAISGYLHASGVACL